MPYLQTGKLLFNRKSTTSVLWSVLNLVLKMDFTVRAAKPEDCKDVHRMIKELAAYDKMPDHVQTSHEDLEKYGFSANPAFQCFVAEVPEEHKSKEGHTTVGYIVYFYTFSTWKGRSMYLEDIYVMPEFRGKGIGKALLSKVAAVARENQCVHLQLTVLDWNTPSQGFYFSNGAQDLTTIVGWRVLRFNGDALDKLAKKDPKN
ncbi:thialysine N-epsilon-acetyltransferase-like [Anguilla rostrata]|uniref:thialysine N-epsilon-acetyltransferase-like n=1 Tax=Anguilla rostrata TaxID=7938 RepID=UPI0030CC2717